MREESNGAQAVWPFSERASTVAANDVEELFSDSELQLTIEEKQRVHEYAGGLFNGRLDNEISARSETNLEELNQTAVLGSIQVFYLEYFDTEEGKQDLLKLGLAGASRDKVRSTLLDIDSVHHLVDSKTRKSIAINSKNWRKAEIAKLLQNNPDFDKDYDHFEGLKVNYDPDKFLNKLSDLQAYRKFHREVRSKLAGDSPSALQTAKSTLLDIHSARVNNMLAELYPASIKLGEQLAHSVSTDKVTSWNERLAGLMPVIGRALSRERKNETEDFEVFSDRFSRRLDFLRNGSAWQDDELTAISPELYKLAQELEETDQPVEDIFHKLALSEEIINRLDTIKWSAPQVKQLCESVLEEWLKLSSSIADWEEIEDRDGFVADDKWQVSIHPGKKNLSIDNAKRVLWIGEDFERTLTQESPAGVLPVVAHELTHVLQSEFDYELGKQIPLAKIKGRMSSPLREAGTIYQERKIQAMLGRHRKTNLYYLRALEVKLSGGNRLEVARAFFNSYTEGKQLDDTAQEKARDLAVDRSLRLFRSGGHNSKPLGYIEQELIVRELLKLPLQNAEALMVAGSSFSIKDLARLHKSDLVQIPESIGLHPAEDVLRIYIDKYLPDDTREQAIIDGQI